MTEEQGDKIIALLEYIAKKLDNIDFRGSVRL